jgi:hypothetical protein
LRADVLVYLSGPIAPKNGRSMMMHATRASFVFYELLRRGVPAFLPHAFCFISHLDAAVGYEEWMAYDLAVINSCSHMLMLPNWEESAGALREKEHAERTGVKVFLSQGELLAALAPHGGVGR